MNTDYLVFLSLYLSSLIIRTGYELLKKAGRVNPKSMIVFAVIFAVMCLMWVSWFSLCPLDPFRFALPDIVRWMALGAVIVGLGLAIGGVVQLRGLENIDHLVTTGLFSSSAILSTPDSSSGFWAGRYITARSSASLLGVRASVTFFIGDDWKKRIWNHGMVMTIGSIARGLGYEK